MFECPYCHTVVYSSDTKENALGSHISDQHPEQDNPYAKGAKAKATAKDSK